MAKRIGEIDEDIIIGGVLLAGAYFFIIKPLMSTFGDDPADTNTVNTQTNKDATDNPFDPNFFPFLDWFNTTQSSSDIQGYMADIQQKYLYHNPQPLDPNSLPYKAAKAAEDLITALQWINFTPDTDTVISTFNQVTSQVEVGFIAAYINYNYSKDLLHFLRYGGNLFAAFPNGVTEAQLAQIINKVNALPVQ